MSDKPDEPTAAEMLGREAEAAILLEAGSKVIAQQMEEISDLKGQILCTDEQFKKKIHALEAEANVMAALLDAKTELLNQKDEELAKLRTSLGEVTRARDIACFNIADLNNQRSLLTQVVNDALVLIDYLVSDLHHAGVVPSVACGIAKKQLDEKTKRLFRKDQPFPKAVQD